MIFNEIYSAYYTTVAKISEALIKGADESELTEIVCEYAFADSVLTVIPNLKSGKWPLVDEDFNSILNNIPTMPLTLIQKRWLKSISLDKRVKLFDVKFPDLSDVEPLFTENDYKLFDAYSDGDPYDDENYIRNFRFIREAIKMGSQLCIEIFTRTGDSTTIRCIPTGLEYSAKDDKFRVIIKGAKYSTVNLGKVISCDLYKGNRLPSDVAKPIPVREVTLVIGNERNSLERVMLHFAHFEKKARKLTDGKYELKIKYSKNDETEILIRILSFGPLVKVTEPQSFVLLIKERLLKQKYCEL